MKGEKTMKKIKPHCRDCSKCPLCWEDWYYGGDFDCGCYIYDDLYGDKLLCYLPGFIKRLIIKYKKHKMDKALIRDCNNMMEWYENLAKESED